MSDVEKTVKPRPAPEELAYRLRQQSVLAEFGRCALAAPDPDALLNELVTNAYKYAYPPGQGGEVRVAGAQAGEGRYRLTIADTGQGLPEGFDLARSGARLGMRVITALARQLGAELTAEDARPGTRFTLLLPVEAAPSAQPPY